MARDIDHPEPRHANVLRLLNRWLTTPEQLGRRLFIPKPTGLLRHSPGSQIHIMPELFLVEHGINPIDFPAEQRDVRAGQLCLIPRGMPHRESRMRTTPFRMLVVAFTSSQVHYHFSVVSANTCRSFVEKGRIETSEVTRITRVLDTIAEIPRDAKGWYGETANTLLFGVLLWLGAVFHSGIHVPSRFSLRIEEAIKLIEVHLHNPALGTTLLAKWLSCSRNHLSSRFRCETGTPVMRYINHERLLKAQYLLTHSQMLVKEVAAACGYDSAHYFSRVFRAHLGCSPLQWRQRQTLNDKLP